MACSGVRVERPVRLAADASKFELLMKWSIANFAALIVVANAPIPLGIANVYVCRAFAHPHFDRVEGLFINTVMIK